MLKLKKVHVDLDESSESDEPPKHHGDGEVIEEIQPEDIKVSYGDDHHGHNHDL